LRCKASCGSRAFLQRKLIADSVPPSGTAELREQTRRTLSRPDRDARASEMWNRCLARRQSAFRESSLPPCRTHVPLSLAHRRNLSATPPPPPNFALRPLTLPPLPSPSRPPLPSRHRSPPSGPSTVRWHSPTVGRAGDGAGGSAGEVIGGVHRRRCRRSHRLLSSK